MLAIQTNAFVETFTKDRKMNPALRCDKIRTARRRLAEGRYDRDELLDRILEAILDDIALG